MREIKLLSIVMAYYNRKALLINTLHSINYYKGDYPVEIIIIDDGSNAEERLSGKELNEIFPYINITVINLIREKGWRVPSIPYNFGFSVAKGDVIMINSVDTIHAGNIIEHVFNNFDLNSYFSYATAWGNKELTERFTNLNWTEESRSDILKSFDPNKNGWRVHGSLGTYIPFCGVINSSDLELLNGYDERFTGGIGYEDHDFEDRVYNLGLNMSIINEPFCIHQDHPLIVYHNTRNLQLLTDLRSGYPKRTKADCNKYFTK